jgi:two-component system response regulator RegA
LDGARILWIDDEVRQNDAEVRLLELEGFHVNCTETGHQGISLAQRRAFDIILLDLRLRHESGLDILEMLRETGVTAAVVILTGFADLGTGIAAMKLGAADYRAKPIDIAEIAPVLRGLIVGAGQQSSSGKPQLSEIEWLRIQCDRFDDCATNTSLAAVVLRILLNPRLSLTAFFGCATALRLALNSTDGAVFVVASGMTGAILRAAETPPPSHPTLRKTLLSLEGSAEKVSQQTFAERVALSRTYLSHLFKRQTDRSASEWCRGAVMRSAVRQVLQTPEQVSQIAYAAGYQHAAHFNHDFRCMFGVAPTELRRLFDSSHPY